MVAHTYNPSTWGAEAGGSPQVKDQTELYSEFLARLSYGVKALLKTEQHKKVQKSWLKWLSGRILAYCVRRPRVSLQPKKGK